MPKAQRLVTFYTSAVIPTPQSPIYHQKLRPKSQYRHTECRYVHAKHQCCRIEYWYRRTKWQAFHDVSQCVLRVFHGVLIVVHNLHSVFKFLIMFSESCNDQHWCLHYIGTMWLPIAAGINNNATGISKNATGIGDNATKVIPF